MRALGERPGNGRPPTYRDRIEEVFDWPRPDRGCWAIPYGRFEPGRCGAVDGRRGSAGAVDANARPLGATTAATAAVATASGSVLQARPASSVTMNLTPSIAPRSRLAATRTAGRSMRWSIATAAGAPLECGGKLPRGRRLLRSARRNARGSARGCSSGHESRRFGPLSVELVRDGQAAVRNSRSSATATFPRSTPIATRGASAQAIARLAISNAVPSLSNDVLWYHANYVAPSWGRRLTRATQIGAHIFYRA